MMTSTSSARPPSVMSQLAERLMKMPAITSQLDSTHCTSVDTEMNSEEEEGGVVSRHCSPPVTPAKRICRSSSAHEILHRPIALRPSPVAGMGSSRISSQRLRRSGHHVAVHSQQLGNPSGMASGPSGDCMTVSLEETAQWNFSFSLMPEEGNQAATPHHPRFPLSSTGRRSAFTPAVTWGDSQCSSDYSVSPELRSSTCPQHHHIGMATLQEQDPSSSRGLQMDTVCPPSPSSGFCGDSVSPGTSLRCSSSISFTCALERAASATAGDTSVGSSSYSPGPLSETVCFLHPPPPSTVSALRTTRCKSQPAAHLPLRHSGQPPSAAPHPMISSSSASGSFVAPQPPLCSCHSGQGPASSLKRKYAAEECPFLTSRILPSRAFGNTRRYLINLPRIASSPVPPEEKTTATCAIVPTATQPAVPLCCGRGSEASTLTGFSSRGDTPTTQAPLTTSASTTPPPAVSSSTCSHLQETFNDDHSQCTFQPISLEDSPLSNHSSDSSSETSSHTSGVLSPELRHRPANPHELSPGEAHTHQWMQEYSSHFQELDVELIEQDY